VNMKRSRSAPSKRSFQKRVKEESELILNSIITGECTTVPISSSEGAVSSPIHHILEDSSIVIRKCIPDSVDETDYSTDDETSTLDFTETSELSLNVSHSSSESDEWLHVEDVVDLKDSLRGWANENNVTLSAVSKLLHILNKHSCFSTLPVDARTLLKTPIIVKVKSVPPGEYHHFGLLNCVNQILKDKTLTFDEIKLQGNVDGIPISNSSNKQFWPIQGFLPQLSRIPFIIGIYCGDSKPDSACVYLEDFVSEIREILTSGIPFQGKQYTLKLEVFICDAPARAFIAGIKNHTGYYGCGKCTTKGSYVENRVIFKDVNAPKRTDESFRNHEQSEHHNTRSALEDLDVGLVSCFPLEYMHLVCLGVVRKLIKLWVTGDYKVFRLQSSQVQSISNNLENCKKYISSEFARDPRPFNEVDRWKATELRQFVLYTGPVVLKSVLDKKHYNLFLKLHVAITILVNNRLCISQNEFAATLLKSFVQKFGLLYGEKHMSYNVHGLIHLSEDCLKFGALDNFSAFKFENNLQFLKQLITSSRLPLQQACRRIQERNNQLFKTNPVKTLITGQNEYSSGTLLKNTFDPQYKTLSFPTCELSLKMGDNVCLMKDMKVVKCENFATQSKRLVVIGQELEIISDHYEKPCSSNDFQISRVKFNSCTLLKVWHIKDIKCKCLALPLKNDVFVVFPIIHTEI